MQSDFRGQIRVFPLKKKKDMRRVFSQGEKCGNSYSVLYYCQNNTQSHLRTGVFIPKKVCKKAVDRNRAKRIIKEVFREQKNDLQGLDIICILKQYRKEEGFLKMLRQQIIPILRGIQCIC